MGCSLCHSDLPLETLVLTIKEIENQPIKLANKGDSQIIEESQQLHSLSEDCHQMQLEIHMKMLANTFSEVVQARIRSLEHLSQVEMES